MLPRGLCIAVCLLLVAPPSRAPGADADAAYAAVRDDYLALKDDAKARRYRHNYLRIIERFERFVRAHPEHEKAPSALYNAAMLAWDLYRVSRVRSDLRRAHDLFVRLANTYPKSPLADDGLFLAGRLLLEHGGDKTQAWRHFHEVVERFPRGDMHTRALEMRGRLSDYAPRERPGAGGKGARGAWHGAGGDVPAHVEWIETWAKGRLARVVVHLSAQAAYRRGEIPALPERGLPARHYVDLRPAILGPQAAAPIAVGEGILKRVRSGQFRPDTVRVVLELDGAATLRIRQDADPSRLIIEVEGEGEGAAPEAELDAAIARFRRDASRAASGAASMPNLSRVKAHMPARPDVPLSVQAGLKVRKIVVDAGHGGHDSGAVGRSGIAEKDVALDIALRVGKGLEKAGFEVVYTRTDDTFVPLERRTALANEENADLFISIHCNAHPKRRFHGVSTYYLDLTDDRYGMRLAARENATSQRSVGELQLILADLATKANVDESIRLATQIQSKTVGTLAQRYDRIKDLGVKYALFYVLIGAKMPAVLVETSFISNPLEERRLRTEAYRQTVADGVVAGVKGFIEERRRLALGR